MTRSAANEHVKVIPTMSQTKALVGISTQLRCLFSIDSKQETPPTESPTTKSRPPINLCLVLDVSTSMRGAKLENCKKAILEIIRSLQSDDVLSFITYSASATLIFQKERYTCEEQYLRLSTLIRRQTCSAGTNIWAGLALASQCLNQAREPSTSRIFLFSDGQVTCGEKNNLTIFGRMSTIRKDQKILTTTFGIGANFDEVMMMGISQHGGGPFYLIDDPSNIGHLVKQATSALVNLLGIETRLVVQGLGCGVVKKIYGHPNLVKGADLGELRTQDVREVLVELEVNPPGGQIETTQEVLSYSLEYIPISSKEPQQSLERLTGTVKLSLVANPDLLDKEENPQTKIALAIQQAAETQEQVVNCLKAGKVEEALKLEKRSFYSLSEVQASSPSSPILAQQTALSLSLQRSMQSHGASPMVVQQVSHSAYQKRMRSSDYDSSYPSPSPEAK